MRLMTGKTPLQLARNIGIGVLAFAGGWLLYDMVLVRLLPPWTAADDRRAPGEVARPLDAGAPARDQERIARLNEIKTVLERYFNDNGSYPMLPQGQFAWGQCSGASEANWIPQGKDFSWSARYIQKMPLDPKAGCNYPFDAKNVGNTQFMYFSDNGKRFVLLAGLEDARNPRSLRTVGDNALPPWFKTVIGDTKSWWGGTYVVTSAKS